ncbi:hypothetical protein ACX801_07890 [Arthrobacter bambusae]
MTGTPEPEPIRADHKDQHELAADLAERLYPDAGRSARFRHAHDSEEALVGMDEIRQAISLLPPPTLRGVHSLLGPPLLNPWPRGLRELASMHLSSHIAATLLQWNTLDPSVTAEETILITETDLGNLVAFSHVFKALARAMRHYESAKPDTFLAALYWALRAYEGDLQQPLSSGALPFGSRKNYLLDSAAAEQAEVFVFANLLAQRVGASAPVSEDVLAFVTSNLHRHEQLATAIVETRTMDPAVLAGALDASVSDEEFAALCAALHGWFPPAPDRYYGRDPESYARERATEQRNRMAESLRRLGTYSFQAAKHLAETYPKENAFRYIIEDGLTKNLSNVVMARMLFFAAEEYRERGTLDLTREIVYGTYASYTKALELQDRLAEYTRDLADIPVNPLLADPAQQDYIRALSDLLTQVVDATGHARQIEPWLAHLLAQHPERADCIVPILMERGSLDRGVVEQALGTSAPLADGVL